MSGGGAKRLHSVLSAAASGSRLELAKPSSSSRGYGDVIGRESRVEETRVVLGVETSCDDTGVAVMRGSGRLLGHCLHSQTPVHKT